MIIRNRRLCAAVAALCLLLAVGGCTKRHALITSKRPVTQPVAPNQPGFDARQVDSITPGLTEQAQVRAWFGEPDMRFDRQDGSSEWVYNKARREVEKPERVAKARELRNARRALEAKEFRESAVILYDTSRRAANRLSVWVANNFFYPPRALRREETDVAANAPDNPTPMVEAVQVQIEDEGSEEGGMLGKLERGEVDTTPTFDLAVLFSRGGVVDEFMYQGGEGRLEHSSYTSVSGE